MGVDTTFYVLLDTTLDRMANQEEIILNRNATDRKMQSVAVNSFLNWNNKFEAISHEFLNDSGAKVNVTDNQLKGEKNLARLRFFGRFWKENERRVENLNFTNVKDLQKEKERIESAVKRLKSFKQELGGNTLNVESIDKLTQKDEKAFQRLSDAIEKLQAKQRVLDKVQHHLKDVKAGNWDIHKWLKTGITQSVDRLIEKSNQPSMNPGHLRKEIDEYRKELLNYQRAGLDVDEALERLNTAYPKG